MKTAQSNTPVITIMTAEALRSVAAQAIKADSKLALATSAHGKTYAVCAGLLRADMPSGIVSTSGYEEYRRRVTTFAGEVAAARMADYEGEDKTEAIARIIVTINKGVDRDNKKAAWIAPREEKSDDEKAVAARKAEATRKAKDRAINKEVAVLKKSNPKTDEKALREIAKEKVKELTAEVREAQKDAANEQKYIEQLAALLVRMPEVFVADTKQLQLRGAALIAELKAIQTKA